MISIGASWPTYIVKDNRNANSLIPNGGGDQTAERKKKNADKILVLDSYLKDLLRYQVSEGGTALDLGTDRVYGDTHQFGDPDRNIPARPFLGLSDQDKAEVLEIIHDHLF